MDRRLRGPLCAREPLAPEQREDRRTYRGPAADTRSMRNEPVRASAKQARDGDVIHPPCGQPVDLGDPDYAKTHSNLTLMEGDTPRVELLCRVCGVNFEVIVVGPLFD